MVVAAAVVVVAVVDAVVDGLSSFGVVCPFFDADVEPSPPSPSGASSSPALFEMISSGPRREDGHCMYADFIMERVICARLPHG